MTLKIVRARAHFSVAILLLLGMSAAMSAPAAVRDVEAEVLVVDTGLQDGVAARHAYTGRSLAALPSETVAVGSDPANTVRYSCTRLQSVLMDAGIPMGKAMRGARLADTVIVTGADGFTVAFALVELDRAFRADPATLCYERDGLPLDAKEGPLRLIVTDDLKKGRWVRQVKSLTVYRAPGP